MKMISKIMLGAMLLTTGTVIAQGKSGMEGNKKNNGNKTIVVTERNNAIKSKESMEAIEHASATGRMHASERSVLNRPTGTTVRVRRTNNGNHYGQRKYHHVRKTYTTRKHKNR